MTADYSLVPADLKEQRRWVAWKFEGDKKPPIDDRGHRLDATNPTSWLSFDEALARAAKHGGGVGFVPGGGFSGFDLDDCLDPETRQLDPMAETILHDYCAGCYAEVSPSGKGIKIFGRAGFPPLELKFNGTMKRGGSPPYFTVTGDAINAAGLGDMVPALEAITRHWEAEPKLATKSTVERGEQHNALVAEAGSLRRRSHDDEAVFSMLRAWADKEFDPKPSDKDIWAIVRSTSGWQEGDGAFELDKDGRPFKTQRNIRRAIDKLGITVREDQFAWRLVYEWEGRKGYVDDAFMDRAWLELDERFRFQPPIEYFGTILRDYARQHPFHPVHDYLDGLRWDGEHRIDSWLIDYGKAKVTDDNREYVRTVGALVLVAAVRRVRYPGCKFDELVILESIQGQNKSTAIQTLCPNEAWFSCSLPLGADAKLTIEGTSGVWIAEVAELHGRSKRDVDQLKASLSRQVDGPVRLAYSREPKSVPRQFITIGTTNKHEYLSDPTGNRRFWPVEVGVFDLDRLEADRDQLWAEASVREASGASIRLPRELWDAAGKQQEARRGRDPWEELLAELVEGQDKVSSDQVWAAVGVSKDRRSQTENERVGAGMRRLGFKPGTVRVSGKACWGYVRVKATTIEGATDV